MTRLIHRVARVLAWHITGEPAARVGEQAAQITVLTGGRRRTRRHKKSASRASDMAGTLTRRSVTSHEHH